MPPVSAAERQRKRRLKLKEEGIYEQYKARNAQYSRTYRTKKEVELKTLPKEDRSGQVEERREKDRERQLRCRNNKKEKVLSLRATETSSSPVAAYSAAHSLARALNRVKRVLPSSPRKRSTVVRKLSTEFGATAATPPSRKARSDGILDDTVQCVKRFFERDDVSRMAPGKRDVVTIRTEIGKKKFQKRHMSMCVKEAYALFKEDYPEVKVGVSKFASLRPQHILLSSQIPSNVCTCVYHENFMMALSALHAVIPSVPSYCKDFAASCFVNPEEDSCWFGHCDHGNMCGFQAKYPLPDDDAGKNTKWMKWEEQNGRLTKSEMKGTVKNLYDYVALMSPKFFRHCYIKRMQAKQYEEDKKNAALPTSHTAVVQMDFSENYTCTAQDEIQSAHWNQAQITLYTSVSWFREHIISHVVVSDHMQHNKTSVVIFTTEVLAKLPHDVTEVKVWTDGPASQFKNKYVISAMQQLSRNCRDVHLQWNFFATSHGKGPVDGVGGTLKRIAADKVRSRKCIVNGMADFIAAVQDSSITVTPMTADTLKQRESELHLDDVFSEAKAVKGISDFHCFEWQDDVLVTKHYGSEILCSSSSTPAIVTLTEAEKQGSENEIEGETSKTFIAQIGHWYAVYWRNNDYWFVGRAIQRKGHLVKLEFIHQTSQGLNRFKTTNDVDTVPEDDVLGEVCAPMPVSSSRCSLLQLTDEDYNAVINSFNTFCHA